MTQHIEKKLIHVGDFVAEVEVEILEDETGWSPYLSLEDARKLDRVREALNKGNVRKASTDAKVYRLTPVA